MTDTDRMVVWLRETMGAAQRDAEAATAATGGPHWHGSDSGLYSNDVSNHPGPFLADVYGYTAPEVVAHTARHDPAAVLRRIAADRKILAAHPYTTRVINPGCGLQSAGFGCENCHNWDGVPEGRGNCATVLALAEGWGWTEEAT